MTYARPSGTSSAKRASLSNDRSPFSNESVLHNTGVGEGWAVHCLGPTHQRYLDVEDNMMHVPPTSVGVSH